MPDQPTAIDRWSEDRRSLLLAGALLLAASLWAATRAVSSGDLWVSLGCGRYILSHGVTRTDPFAFTSPPGTWVNQNWLSHVLFSAIHSVSGLSGLAIWRILAAGATLLLLGRSAIRLGASRTMAGLAILAMAVVGRPYIDSRPNLHTLLLSAALIAWLTGGGAGRARRYGLLLAMLVLWANLHGGFLFGILALGAAGVAGALRSRRLVPELLLPIAAIAASIVSPYGIANLTHPWEVSAGEAAQHWRRVAEWRPAFAPGALADPGVRAFWIIVLAGIAAALLALRDRRRRADDSPEAGRGLRITAVALVAFGLAAASRRFIPLFAIAALPPIAASFTRAWPRLRVTGPLAAILVGVLLIAACADFASRLLLPNGLWPRSLGWSSRLVRVDEQPREAADFVVSSEARGRIFTDWLWGGYLLYSAPLENGTTRYKIYIDGRAQAAYPARISIDLDALEAAAGRRDSDAIRAFLDSYAIDLCVLDRRGSGLAEIVPELEGWVGLYADDKAVIAARESHASSLAQGRFPEPAIAEASVALRLRTGGGSIAEAFGHALRSVRVRPTTVGVTEMTRLALADASADAFAQAAAECDRILGTSIDDPPATALATRANTAQCRSILASRQGNRSEAARLHAEALRLAAEAEAIAPRYLR